MLFLLIVKRSFSLLLVLSTGPGLGVSSFSLTWIVLSVIDLAWKIFHWVLYTAERLSSFDYDLSTTCFCANQRESLQHLFFYCPLAVITPSWLQSLMFLAASLFPTILLRRVLFGFSSDELSLVPQVFICLTFVNFAFGWIVTTFVLGASVPRLCMSWSVSNLVFVFIFLCFSLVVFLFVNGVLVVRWGARGVVASFCDNVLVVHN